MSYKPGDSFECYFTTETPSTGAATDADALPTAVFKRNGATDEAVTLTVASTGAQGEYKVTGTIPGGYASGDRISVMATAIMGGVTGRASLGTWVLAAARVDANITAVNGVTVGGAGVVGNEWRPA